MTLSDRVFQYCERGTNPSLLAEPVNALSNIAFVVAGAAVLYMLLRQPSYRREIDHYVLTGLIFCIGVGSFLFHTFANRWSALADAGPIVLFVLIYTAYALARFLVAPPGMSYILTSCLAAATIAGLVLTCGPGNIALGDLAAACLNGGVGYVPTLIVLALIAYLMHRQGHKATSYVMWASMTFAGALAMRMVDLQFCAPLTYHTHAIGSHFLWHVLVAVTLYLLMKAAIDHPGMEPRQIIIPPRSSKT